MIPSNNGSKKDDKEPVTMASRILGFCFAIFLGVILLYLALELLGAIWGWLLLVGGTVAIIWIALALYRRWHDGW